MKRSLGGQKQSGENNFDHDQCYRDDLHAKSTPGHQWCREHGPASRSSRDYAGRATSGTAEKYLPGGTESGDVNSDAALQRSRRAQAAEQYRPDRIRLLLIAEAPPADPNRYFYFHEVNTHDSLFRHVIRSLLGVEPTRENKPELLAQLQQRHRIRVLDHHHWKILSPAAKRRAVDMLTTTLGMSERLACTAVGLARSTFRRLPQAQTPADPDAEMRAWLRFYATKNRATASAVRGRRCATTSAARSTRRRSTGSGAKKVCTSR